MNTGRNRHRPVRPDDARHDKDRAFIASLPALSTDELARLRRHYKKEPWRVAAIDRASAKSFQDGDDDAPDGKDDKGGP